MNSFRKLLKLWKKVSKVSEGRLFVLIADEEQIYSLVGGREIILDKDYKRCQTAKWSRKGQAKTSFLVAKKIRQLKKSSAKYVV